MRRGGLHFSVFHFLVYNYTVDKVYEGQQKKTYLSMLIQVGIFLPLLVGLLLLYPWLAGSHKYSQENEDTEQEEDKTIRLFQRNLTIMKTLYTSNYLHPIIYIITDGGLEDVSYLSQ